MLHVTTLSVYIYIAFSICFGLPVYPLFTKFHTAAVLLVATTAAHHCIVLMSVITVC
jgi:hypothetical protein